MYQAERAKRDNDLINSRRIGDFPRRQSATNNHASRNKRHHLNGDLSII